MWGHVALGLLPELWDTPCTYMALGHTPCAHMALGSYLSAGHPLRPRGASTCLRARHTLARTWCLGCARREPCTLSTWGHLTLGSLRWNQWTWVRRQDSRSMGRA